MKELKILAVLVILTGITYWGIEPLAHSIMHPHVEPADFEYKDLKAIPGDGDVAVGKELTLAYCVSCHSIKNDNVPVPVSKDILISEYGVQSKVDVNFEKLANRYLSELYGVVPLDLSNVATIYDEKFLKHFIKDPAKAAFESTYNLHKTHQMHLDMAKAKSEKEQKEIEETTQKDIESFKNKNKIAMPNLGIDDTSVNHIVAYLKSIAKPLEPKETLELACGRCHSVSYDHVQATAPDNVLKKYLGKIPPDLSMMIRSKGHHYLTVFLNDPQKVLIGSSMPRVGLNKESEAKVIEYLEHVGDSKKEERNSLGVWVLLYLTLFAIMAYLWKRQIFKEVH